MGMLKELLYWEMLEEFTQNLHHAVPEWKETFY